MIANNISKLIELTKAIRYDILTSTTKAGSGHPTSSLSAVELMTVLFFGGFFYADLNDPHYELNDRIIFSKGHAAPLLYSLYRRLGVITDSELYKLRQFESNLEGHPTPRFPYVEIATGSLGQGLSGGIGIALGQQKKIKSFNIQLKRQPKTFVLLGDSETAEGQIWEAIQLASYYKLHNLIGIIDVNRLGQRGETMLGWNTQTYSKRIESFGWKTVVVDGHDINQIINAYNQITYENHSLSYLMGTEDLDPTKLQKLQINIVEKNQKGHYKLIIPNSSLPLYLDYIALKLKPGYWVEIVGKEITFLFKTKDNRIKKISLYPGTAASVAEFIQIINPAAITAPPSTNANLYSSILNMLENGSDGFYSLYFKPKMIIAKTIKGKGVSFWENKNGWHSKQIRPADLTTYLKELGDFDHSLTGKITQPEKIKLPVRHLSPRRLSFSLPKNKLIATKEIIGETLNQLIEKDKNIMVLDAELSNSTSTDVVKEKFPANFLEMFIAEQNMISVASGLSTIGYLPFVSSFAAFFTRAFDQLRMAQYSQSTIKILGSYAGCSIGYDGPSGMGLEDIAMIRSILHSIIVYPSDAISAVRLLELIYRQPGISYIRLTREKTPLIYSETDEFVIGGSKTLFSSPDDQALIIGAGITVHEAIKAYHELRQQNISVTVVDAYSLKPLDAETISHLAKKTKNVVVVEDHYPAGGLGEAVAYAIQGLGDINFRHLAVNKIPRSGTPANLLSYEKIDSKAIVASVLESIKKHSYESNNQIKQ